MLMESWGDQTIGTRQFFPMSFSIALVVQNRCNMCIVYIYIYIYIYTNIILYIILVSMEMLVCYSEFRPCMSTNWPVPGPPFSRSARGKQSDAFKRVKLWNEWQPAGMAITWQLTKQRLKQWTLSKIGISSGKLTYLWKITMFQGKFHYSHYFYGYFQ